VNNNKDKGANTFLNEFLNNSTAQRKEEKENLVFLESTEDEKKKPIHIGGGIHDFLVGKDRNYTMKLALALERYHKKQTGTEHFLGGLHDYIFKMSDHDIREFIVKMTNKYEELKDYKKLEALMDDEPAPDTHKFDPLTKNKNSSQQEMPDFSLLQENSDSLSVVDAFLKKMNRDELENTAYATERYIKQKNHIEDSAGGLHDFIWRMDDEQLRNHILRSIKDYPELDCPEKLKTITEEYLHYMTGDSPSEIVNERADDKFAFLEDVIKIEKQNEVNKLEMKICRTIKKLIRKLNLEELTSLFHKLAKIVGGVDESDIQYLKTKELRRYIEKFIEKHHDKLNDPNIFIKED